MIKDIQSSAAADSVKNCKTEKKREILNIQPNVLITTTYFVMSC